MEITALKTTFIPWVTPATMYVKNEITAQEIEENTIQNVISPELEAQLAEDFAMEEKSGEEVEFDPDSVTEY